MGDISMSFNFIEHENDEDDIDVFDKLYQLFAPVVDATTTTDDNVDAMLSSDTYIVEHDHDQQVVDQNGLFHRKNILVTKIQTQNMYPILNNEMRLESVFGFVAESTTVGNPWKVDQNRARQVSPHDSNSLSHELFAISLDLDSNRHPHLIRNSNSDEVSLPEANVFRIF
jgi:hypothetical protein